MTGPWRADEVRDLAEHPVGWEWPEKARAALREFADLLDRQEARCAPLLEFCEWLCAGNAHDVHEAMGIAGDALRAYREGGDE